MSFWPRPREWTCASRRWGLRRASGSVGPAAVRSTCGPLKHSCSGTLREDGGRASGGRWDPHAHGLEHSAPLIPRSSASFLGEAPPALGLAPPLGFPHPGPDRSGPSLEADLSPALTVSTEGTVSKSMLMPRLSGQSGLESATASGLQGQSGPQPDFPGGAVVKDLPASVGDMGSIPGSGRPPEKRNG